MGPAYKELGYYEEIFFSEKSISDWHQVFSYYKCHF